jgi:hypothetical protein
LGRDSEPSIGAETVPDLEVIADSDRVRGGDAPIVHTVHKHIAGVKWEGPVDAPPTTG